MVHRCKESMVIVQRLYLALHQDQPRYKRLQESIRHSVFGQVQRAQFADLLQVEYQLLAI
jgi:hypothetical protein